MLAKLILQVLLPFLIISSTSYSADLVFDASAAGNCSIRGKIATRCFFPEKTISYTANKIPGLPSLVSQVIITKTKFPCKKSGRYHFMLKAGNAVIVNNIPAKKNDGWHKYTTPISQDSIRINITTNHPKGRLGSMASYCKLHVTPPVVKITRHSSKNALSHYLSLMTKLNGVLGVSKSLGNLATQFKTLVNVLDIPALKASLSAIKTQATLLKKSFDDELNDEYIDEIDAAYAEGGSDALDDIIVEIDKKLEKSPTSSKTKEELKSEIEDLLESIGNDASSLATKSSGLVAEMYTNAGLVMVHADGDISRKYKAKIQSEYNESIK